MDRKTFIKTCGLTCLGGGLLSAVLDGCAGSKMINGPIDGSDIIVPLREFEDGKGASAGFKQYLIVHNDQLQFPICVYRHSASEYSALWMRCPHQGAELQAFGDKLVCPAHGSEFSSKGFVKTGPADNSLRTFPCVLKQDQLSISLKAPAL